MFLTKNPMDRDVGVVFFFKWPPCFLHPETGCQNRVSIVSGSGFWKVGPLPVISRVKELHL